MDVVIAVDNSEECVKAVDFALKHFQKGYTYHLIHVQPRPVSDTRLTSDADSSMSVHVQHTLKKDQDAASKDFLERVFVPRASSGGAKVKATMLPADSDSSTSIGQTICQYVHQAKPDVLILMKQNKTAVTRFFMGSVTRYCATECDAPVIIVPP
ncbi:g8455 [Coccomyxa viridis]|uniref:G8455 protein n=1 Tax=Coccomyxa viridis TaxID=1274662 RepID=A0ABP1G0J6_9CHLO